MALYFEGGTFLHKLNPLVKLAMSFAAIVHMILFPSFWPMAVHVVTGIVLLAYVRPRLPRALWVAVFTLFVGHAWVNAALYRGGTPIAELGPIVLTWEGVMLGFKLALRVLAIVFYSLLAAATTNPRDLAVSLANQLGVDYRYAYATHVTFRMAPLVKRDLENILLSRKMRGYRGGGLIGRIVSVIAPLMALVVKRSITMSLSMESRGFGAYKERTYYKPVKVKKIDYVVASLFLVYLFATTITLHMLGLLGPMLQLTD